MKPLVALLLILSAPLIVYASGPKQTARTKVAYQFSYTPIYQIETELDVGGKFDVQRHFLRLDTSRFINQNWMVGVGLSLDYENWNFSDIAGLAGADLWDEIVRPGISVPIFFRTDSNWLFALIPSLDFAGASGAEIDEALSYGAVLSAAYTFNPNLTLGLGGGIFDRLDQMEFFPYVVIDWQINDRLQLTNPFRAGPVGPAGLELVYRTRERLEMGIGGAYRSYRFRLDDSSAIADGIGQVDFWAGFVRMSWPLGRQVHLDLNGGALYSGQITIEDRDANELGDTGYETAPFIGLTLRGRF
jgi:hypothetical protein